MTLTPWRGLGEGYFSIGYEGRGKVWGINTRMTQRVGGLSLVISFALVLTIQHDQFSVPTFSYRRFVVVIFFRFPHQGVCVHDAYVKPMSTCFCV